MTLRSSRPCFRRLGMDVRWSKPSLITETSRWMRCRGSRLGSNPKRPIFATGCRIKDVFRKYPLISHDQPAFVGLYKQMPILKDETMALETHQSPDRAMYSDTLHQPLGLNVPAGKAGKPSALEQDLSKRALSGSRSPSTCCKPKPRSRRRRFVTEKPLGSESPNSF